MEGQYSLTNTMHYLQKINYEILLLLKLKTVSYYSVTRTADNIYRYIIMPIAYW